MINKLTVLRLFFYALSFASCNSQKDKGPAEIETTVNIDSLLINEKPSLVKGGTELYNVLQIGTNIKIGKAFLVAGDGKIIPPDNKADFNQAVILIIKIDSGWISKNGRVYLDGDMQVYDKKENKIFEMKSDRDPASNGISEADAKTLQVAVSGLEKVTGDNVTVTFGFKDNNGPGYISGAFKLYNK